MRVLLALALLLAAPPAAAQVGLRTAPRPPEVRFAPERRLAGDVAALPQIAAPRTAATTRINAELKRQDGLWLKARRECLAEGRDSSMDRSAEVAMGGPQFLAVVASHDIYCQGMPHPSNWRDVNVFDLATGAPVDWSKLAPGVRQEPPKPNADIGDTSAKVRWPALRALYLRKARAAMDRETWAECEQPLSDEPEGRFDLWPDAKAGGVRVAPAYLPRVVMACGDEVVLGPADLQALRVAPRLIEAIAAAHRRPG